MADTSKVEFLAEIKKTTSRTAVSLDKVYQAVFETSDGTLMNLSTIAPDQLVKVTVELAE